MRFAPSRTWRFGSFATGHAARDREQLQALRLAAQELGADAASDDVGRQHGTVEYWL